MKTKNSENEKIIFSSPDRLGKKITFASNGKFMFFVRMDMDH
jgi:hypothetical protein